MSRGQKPRTPQYFPKMKVRGKRRRRVAPYQRISGAFMHMGHNFGAIGDAAAAAAQSFTGLALSLERNRELAKAQLSSQR